MLNLDEDHLTDRLAEVLQTAPLYVSPVKVHLLKRSTRVTIPDHVLEELIKRAERCDRLESALEVLRDHDDTY